MIEKNVDKGAECGFSLVELMVVIAIIGILLAVAAPAYFNHMSRSRQSYAVNELMAIRASEEMYFAENGNFADKIGLLQLYASAGTIAGAFFESPFYRYDILDIGGIDTIRALGDLNGDGNFTDEWRLPVDDLAAKPEFVPGGDEGFSWSSLGDNF